MTTLVPKVDFKNGGTTPAGAINRPITSKLQDIICVKDFGAVGDGTTDDTAAFNAAILATALAGGVLFYKDSGGTVRTLSKVNSAPVTATADYTVTATNVYVINNKSGSTQTVTLPAPSTNTGRVLTIQNYQAQTVVSASNNVVPQGGGAAGTAILAASVGDSTTLVSDGTNWVIIQYASNNNLLLE